MKKEQHNYQPDITFQRKVAHLDFAVYQCAVTGRLSFHLLDKRLVLKHDAHPVLRLPSTKSLMWEQAVVGTLQGELHRANGRSDRIAFFVATSALMVYEDLRCGAPWKVAERILRLYWDEHHPFLPDGLGDGAGDSFAIYRSDILALVSYLWRHGSVVQDQRNARIGWSPPT